MSPTYFPNTCTLYRFQEIQHFFQWWNLLAAAGCNCLFFPIVFAVHVRKPHLIRVDAQIGSG